uniref:Uncharacterized protein n=1 Tax=Amphimedon queenslandica TaxID=400682 RepID=A0A1X7VS02_AMPQE
VPYSPPLVPQDVTPFSGKSKPIMFKASLIPLMSESWLKPVSPRSPLNPALSWSSHYCCSHHRYYP